MKLGLSPAQNPSSSDYSSPASFRIANEGHDEVSKLVLPDMQDSADPSADNPIERTAYQNLFAGSSN